MSENRNSFIEATKPTDERLEALKQFYPELFSDGKLNIDVLKEITGGENPQEDRTPGYYGLYWPGKRKAKIEAKASPKGTLVPVPGDGVNEDTTHNIYIEGDNLEVLRILKQSYKGRVKMIYIDPPYNTGNDFIYPDDYKMPVEEYKRLTGQTDEKGNTLTTNQKSNGAFHTKWLNMMLPRLMLARELLTEDGVIFISIDDNEQSNLRLLCDDIFGEENFIAYIIHKNNSMKNQSKYIGITTEYVLIYSKNMEYLKEKEPEWRIRKKGTADIKKMFEKLKEEGNSLETIRDEILNMYSRPKYSHLGRWNKVDEGGVFTDKDLSRANGYKDFTIKNPNTGKDCLIPSRGWGKSKSELIVLQEKGMIWYGDDSTPPREKSYLSDDADSVCDNYIYVDTSVDKKMLETMFGSEVFDYPKPLEMINTFLQLAAGNEEIVLDFFSGSATTAHAVMQYNAGLKKKCKFIMVQLPEKLINISEPTVKNAIELCDKLGKQHTICEIGKERIRRAGAKILEEAKANKDIFSENNPLDIGFKVFRMQESNFKEYTPVQGQDENATKSLFEELENNQIPLVDGWKTENVLTEIILKQGFALDCECKKVESFTKNTVYCIKDSEGPASRTTTMYVCLDSQVDSDTIEKLKLDEKEKFVCLNNAIDDTSYARLADKGRIETI